MKTCFVVMGFHTKTDYPSGRVLDLDKSYQYIIKPAVEAAGLKCERADEIPNNGLIDVPMYDRLLSADVVIADISTCNPNALYELGVRHALRPYTTITIAEDKMTYPFDVNHIAVKRYTHLGVGIDYAEVVRMQGVLVDAIKSIVDPPQSDSPIYTFFTDLEPPVRRQIKQAVAAAAPAVATQNQVLSTLVSQGKDAIENSDFITAKAAFEAARKAAPNDPYLIQQLALATYKAKIPDALQALREAQAILAELKPEASIDPETLGLWGAIHKRLWQLNGKPEDLDTAITGYSKGFNLKNDYYNGINVAFLYDLRASKESGDEAIADSVTAQRIRKRVVSICENSLSQIAQLTKLEPADMERKFWILATLAEAWIGLGNEKNAQDYLAQAKNLNQPAWMWESTLTQLNELRKLLAERTEA